MKVDLSFATPDWAERLQRHEMPIDLAAADRYLNQTRVAAALKLFDSLCCPDVPGQPTMREAAAPWQREIVRLAAGGLQKDGKQSVGTLGVMVPKKNNKTTFSAAMTLTLATMSPRPNAEFLLIGAEQSIANIAFNQLAGMIACSDAMRDMWHVREHLKRIENRQSGVSITVKTFSMEAVTGSKPAFALIDEAHLLTGADAARVIGQIRGGMAAIPEGLLIWISTQSDIAPRGFWKDELTKARAVRDGALHLPGYAPVLYEPPPGMATDLLKASHPDLWRLVNPSLGYSISEAWLVASFREALAVGEHEIRRWLSQHANVEIAAFEIGDDAWGGAQPWERGRYPGLTFDLVIATAETLVIGLDGGGLDDLLGVTVLGLCGGQWLTATKAFCYPIVFERRMQIAGLLRDFEASGDLVVMGEADGLEPVIGLLLSIQNERGGFAVLAADPNGVAVEIGHALLAAGFPPGSIVGVKQGWGLRPGYQALERRLRAGTLQHAGQPLFDWSVANARVDAQGLVTKKVAGSAKIDCLVALATAAVVMMEQPEPFNVGLYIG
ncbi:terminase large subunit domain-containing protein [Pseudomonas sp. OV226]|uniref:terminase large subunit domain-containing protein n=1 Tax=Pseudomonas sp. OV226 TaxID=2135588 RepID=UPI000D6D84E8|nr:terminase large subunit [Pseudomonas sp. OV226]PWK32570.1 phage terminase large subunit-like protein [Pseudomonas sp. OV226]